MDKIFLEVIRLSALAGGMVLAVLAIRLLLCNLLRKAPKSLHCLLWMLVGVRLMIPFSIESVFGLFPEQGMLETQIFGASTEGMVGSTILEQVLPAEVTPGQPLAWLRPDEDMMQQKSAVNKMAERERGQRVLQIGTWIWCAGVLLMSAYFVYSWFKIRACIRGSKQAVYPLESGETRKAVRIFWCDNIETPFLFGILHPEIYIPLHMDEEDLPYIVHHELAHQRRRDHLVKPAAFFLLAVHWFNPCIWIAYKMLCRDMELACDEMVIRDMKVKDRKAYSRALLNCSVWQEKVAAAPVAFGELNVKERIKNILNYRKPTVLAVCLGMGLCVVLLFCFMTQRKTENGKRILLTNEAGKAEEVNVQVLREAEKAEITDLGVGESEEINELQTAQERELEQVTDQEKSLTHVKEWADAFCDRDGKTIVSLCSDEVLDAFREKEIIITEEGEEPSFGWSSPWPWDSGTDYRIVDMTDTTARVLYYAWTSDPHVTVWEENLTWHVEGERYLMDRSELTFRDNLCTSEEFYSAYPEGIINGTEMDYLSNGAGEALNNNAKESKDIYESYESLFSPDTAARFLLNLLNNDEKVKITVEEEDGKAQVSIEFVLDHTQVQVTMVQPYGADGIWIPQTWEG